MYHCPLLSFDKPTTVIYDDDSRGNEKGYTGMPPKEERLCLINDDINSENKFAWLEVNKDDSHLWDIYDIDTNFTQL